MIATSFSLCSDRPAVLSSLQCGRPLHRKFLPGGRVIRTESVDTSRLPVTNLISLELLDHRIDQCKSRRPHGSHQLTLSTFRGSYPLSRVQATSFSPFTIACAKPPRDSRAAAAATILNVHLRRYRQSPRIAAELLVHRANAGLPGRLMPHRAAESTAPACSGPQAVSSRLVTAGFRADRAISDYKRIHACSRRHPRIAPPRRPGC
jgi:hypothetical protein